jgi:hypothetical protein
LHGTNNVKTKIICSLFCAVLREEAYELCFKKSLFSGYVTGEFCTDCKNFAPVFGYSLNSAERLEVVEGHPTPFSQALP